MRAGRVRTAALGFAALCAAAAAVPAQTASSPKCTISVYPRAGAPSSGGKLHGPGLVLSGAGLLGMPYPEVLRWMRAQIRPGGERWGNLLILQASGENDYTQGFYKSSRFASVQEMLIPPCAGREMVDRTAHYAEAASAVLFVGGDQANYVPWRGSALMAAVRGVYGRGGVVGGGSAGLAIQGAVIYDAVAADRVLPDDENLGSPLATRDPYGPAVSLTPDMFGWPPLANTITDSHFAKRDRFGRLAAFMARALHGKLIAGDRVYGLGIDEGSVLLVDRRGVATLHELTGEPYHTKGAYVLSGGPAQRIARGKPLLYTVDVVHLSRAGQHYDLTHHRGDGEHYRVTVDGAQKTFYSRNPY